MTAISEIYFLNEYIKLLPENLLTNKNNKYTLIVGENATGKTRLLNKIVQSLLQIDKNITSKSESKKKLGIEIIEKKPANLMVVTTAYNDKFPFVNNEDNSFYNYCGIRETSNGSWTSSLSRKTIENICNISGDNNKSESLIKVLDILGFSSDIKIEITLKNKRVMMDPLVNKKYIEKAFSSNASNRYRMQSKSLDGVGDDMIEKCLDVLNLIKFEQEAKHGYIPISLSVEAFDLTDTYKLIDTLRRVGLIKDIELKLDNDKNKNSHLFKDASSGESQLLFSLSSIIRYVKKGSVIIIDEPEISLHPNWQIKYFSILKSVLNTVSECHIIVASHSHFLVSDLDPNTSYLVSLVRGEDGVLAKEVDVSTFGWSPESILYNIFNVRTSTSLYLERDLNKALHMIATSDPDLEKLMLLRDKFNKLTFDDVDPLNQVIKSINGHINTHG
jgi:predicted ATPase